MSGFKALLAIGAVAIASLTVGGVSPAFADPTGTTFDFGTVNFQGDGGAVGVSFGVATAIPGSGVTLDTAVSTSVPIPSLTLGGLDFIEIRITSDDSGFLNADSSIDSVWALSGLNWGPGSAPAVGAGLVFLSFDVDGTFVDLTPFAGLPIVPNPSPGVAFGADAIPIGVAGVPVDFIATFDTASLLGPLLSTLIDFGVPFGTALSVDGMSVGFEVTHIPEPASIALMGVALCSTLLMRRRK